MTTDYQVRINNNGAFLKGTVSLLMKLPEGAQPMGLASDGNIMYVADSSGNVASRSSIPQLLKAR